MSFYPEFGELFDAYLSGVDMSGAQLARRLNVNPATITRWRNGQSRPRTPELVVRLADLLGIYGAEREELVRSAGYSVKVDEPPADAPAYGGGRDAAEHRVPESLESPHAWHNFPISYRAQELSQMANWLQIGASGIIMGTSGVGISKLLHFLIHRPEVLAHYLNQEGKLNPERKLKQEHKRQRKYVAIMLDFSAMFDPSLPMLYRMLLHAFFQARDRLGEPARHLILTDYADVWRRDDLFELQHALYELIARLGLAGTYVVLICDRLDLLGQWQRPDLCQALRNLRDVGRHTLSFVAGMRLAPDELAMLDRLGPLRRVLTTHIIYLTALNSVDTDFIIDTHLGHARSLLSDAARAQIHQLTGGYSSLIKAVCYWWLSEEEPPEEAQWGAALLGQPGLRFRLEEILSCLNADERAAMRLLAVDDRPQSQSAVEPSVLQSLIQKGLCMRTQRHIRLFCTLMAGYLALL
ncbi:MAG: helix-turn-helix domain-containing protein [Caldilineaceae bacterium]|nr:helix-turn-helix domain-containing protein [Caldilineaceae bacterium]